MVLIILGALPLLWLLSRWHEVLRAHDCQDVVDYITGSGVAGWQTIEQMAADMHTTKGRVLRGLQRALQVGWLYCRPLPEGGYGLYLAPARFQTAS